jgi:hypothetical protein
MVVRLSLFQKVGEMEAIRYQKIKEEEMADARQIHEWRHARFFAVLLGAVLAIVLMLGIRASAAQACSGGEVCAWPGAFYAGSQAFLVCPSGTGYELIIPEMNSAKNNCGGEYIRIGWAEGGSTNWKACMNPGGERPNPGRFNRYERVGGC